MRKVLILLATVLFSMSVRANEMDLDQYKGKVVYLDFWASWCGPCRSSFPWMNEMQSRFSKLGFQVVAVNLDQQPELAQKFLAQFPVSFQIAYDKGGDMAKKFGVQAMPTSFLIDKNGKTVSMHRGFHIDDEDAYEAEIEKLIQE